MRIIAKFMCKEDCPNIKFNGICVESKWLESMIDELSAFMNSYCNMPICSVKFHMWLTGAEGESISFIIDADKTSIKEQVELEYALYRQFKGNELFYITQKDIDNFTYNNSDYWVQLIDDIKEDMGRWLYPMLERVKIQEIED